jgi:predicted exporter
MSTMPDRRWVLGMWLLALILCGVVAVRAPLRTDMAAFLPHSASMAQKALTDQVNSGAASHLILAAVVGAPSQVLAALSLGLATRLRQQPAFIGVANGDQASFAKTQDFVWRNRYLLSSSVSAGQFTVAGLHAALENDLGLLGSDLGVVLQSSLPSDPTGEALTLMRQLGAGPAPQSRDGVWFSQDGSRALLLLHTTAPGFDIEGQQRALTLIDAAFSQTRASVPAAGAARLLETGPGVFAVRIRDTTKHDVTRLSLLASAGAAGLLLFAYRSPLVLLLGLLPVASGALAAAAAVALDFGFVHGVTLGFGVTLIGESLDYPIYLFTQTMRGEPAHDTLTRIWPTLRLGAITSVVGFGAMLFSNFVGFAQLGLFSIVGLIAAACVTRFVLPELLPQGFFAPGADVLAKPPLAVMRHRRWIRLIIVAVVAAATLALAMRHRPLWDPNLDDLSPIPAADQALDKTLRHDLGVSGLRYVVVFKTRSEQQALEESETLAGLLNGLEANHQLGSFDVPTAILPSEMTQRQRQAALPPPDTLRARFAAASVGMPFRAGTFDGFFSDVARTRSAPLLTQSSLPPDLALRLHSMLVRGPGGWTVIASLAGVTDPASFAASLAAAHLPGVQFVDLDHESAQLLRTFQRDATLLASIGSLAILIVLSVGLKSIRRVLAVAAPLAAAIIVTAALLTMNGGTLSIFMVVGFLLIIAVGSNYCLFFNRRELDREMQRRSMASIVLANLCTVSAYGLMSLSRLPVLHDIGITVAIGTFLSLLFAAAISTRDLASAAPDLPRLVCQR